MVGGPFSWIIHHVSPSLTEAFISAPLLMWLIEQISRKQQHLPANITLGRLFWKALHLYIQQDWEKVSAPTSGSISLPPRERGLRHRNSSACVLLHDFPPEAIAGRHQGKEIYYTFALADLFSGGFISKCPPPPPVSVSLPASLSSIQGIWSFLGGFSINMSAVRGFCGAEGNYNAGVTLKTSLCFAL